MTIFNNKIQKELNEFRIKKQKKLLPLIVSVFNTFIYRITEQENVKIDYSFTFENSLKTTEKIIKGKYTNFNNKSFTQLLNDISNEDLFEDKNFMVDEFSLFVNFGPIQDRTNNNDINYIIKYDGCSLFIQIESNFPSLNSDIFYNLSDNFELLIQDLLKFPEERIDKLNFTTSEELDKLKLWNKTDCDFEQNICLHQKLETTAEIDPSLIALQWQEGQMTYWEVNRQANQLSHYILRIIPEGEHKIIAVCMDRSPEMIISIFAILKAGCSYLPISTNYPKNRVQTIIGTANPELILTKTQHTALFTSYSDKTVDVLQISEELHNQSDENPKLNISSSNLAYIIYTSGSTGIPKGVMIKHYSVINRLSWMQKHNPLGKNDALLQKTPITFDVSVWELFWWTFTGSRLVLLPPGAEKEPETITEYIKKYKISAIHFVPSMFNTYITYLENGSNINFLTSVKTIYCSGEALTRNITERFYNLSLHSSSKAKIVNLYGPTEATVDVSYFDCSPQDKGLLPIGRPIDNTQLYVVNKHNCLQPLNIPGELIICGVNLAKGYYKNEALTSERFIEIELFGKKTCAYKTGDICYWSNDGNIYYVGRVDNQIKLRGIRIELGEIEAGILQIPEVKSCIAILVNPGTERAYIAAFYEKKSLSQVSPSIIKKYLSEILHEAMIPSIIKEVKEIPVNIHGKADKNALINLLDTHTTGNQLEIGTNNEKRIYEIWKKILKKDDISLTGNFFEQGGNSLLLVQMLIYLKKEFKKEINVMTIMKNPNIKALAKFLSDNKI